jgi:hypothetical protein
MCVEALTLESSTEKLQDRIGLNKRKDFNCLLPTAYCHLLTAFVCAGEDE